MGGDSIYGGKFDDENFHIRWDEKPYTLGMASNGPNSNRSQFVFSLAPNGGFNDKMVAIGEMIDGFHLLDDLEKIANEHDQ